MRVIAGALRGRRLVAPGGRDTRPTSDRVRESLFMILGSLEGQRVVDLFAGSGALGIEALSRGAASAEFVEGSRGALHALGQNLSSLGLEDRTRVWKLLLPGGLARIGELLAEADVVFVDPPYGGHEAREVLDWLGRPGAVSPGCRVVIEHHAKDAMPERCGALARMDVRRYGETHLTFYALGGGESPAPS